MRSSASKTTMNAASQRSYTRALGTLLVLFMIGMRPAIAAETVSYVYTDEKGSVLAKADAAGTIVTAVDYHPYGAHAMGGPDDSPGFAGHVEDPEDGFVYMQARYFDPAIGRFLSTDPIRADDGAPLGLNRYSYANNNPITGVDPNGMFPHNMSRQDMDCEIYGCESTSKMYFQASSSSSGGIDKSSQSATPSLSTYVVQDEKKGRGRVIVRQWVLSDVSEDGGYVIQKIDTAVKDTGSGGTRTVRKVWWEAFRVEPGQNIALDNDTVLINPNSASLSGSNVLHASARFYPNLTLPPSFRLSGERWAGTASSTATDPHLDTTKASNEVKLDMTTTW
jgi:RHS repeat-associated protein